MRSEDFNKLDKIASSYFIKADVLFSTINFTSVAISHSTEGENQKLLDAFDHLKEIVDKQTPFFSEHGSHNDLVMKHMPSLCFSSLVSAFEDFIIEIASLILRREPERLSTVKCEYGLFSSLDTDSIIDYLISEKVSSLTFGSAREYINKICKIVSIDKKEIEHLIKPYIEMKARRDIGVHNNWIKDSKYQRKIAELGITDTNENYLKPDLTYFKRTYYTCGEIVKIICNNISVNILNEGILL